jgi:hypothetical protein
LPSRIGGEEISAKRLLRAGLMVLIIAAAIAALSNYN